MNKKHIIIGITCGFLLITGVLYSCAFRGKDSAVVLSSSLQGEDTQGQSSENQTTENIVSQAAEKQVQDKEIEFIYVHICGAVVKPGVYQLETGNRVCDVIKLSGGLSKNAAGDFINQASLITDGQKIYIPTLDEVEDLPAGEYMEGIQGDTEETGETDGLININTASVEDLMSLPGIGQAKADSIIEYREANGEFQKIEDIMNISGIKEGLFNRISNCIIVK